MIEYRINWDETGGLLAVVNCKDIAMAGRMAGALAAARNGAPVIVTEAGRRVLRVTGTNPADWKYLPLYEIPGVSDEIASAVEHLRVRVFDEAVEYLEESAEQDANADRMEAAVARCEGDR